MPSKLYNRETAKRVIEKYPSFPHQDTEAQEFIIRAVYGDTFNKDHFELWKQRNPKIIYSTARNIHEALQERLKQPETESDLEREVESQPIRVRELQEGQTSLFDGKPHTWE